MPAPAAPIMKAQTIVAYGQQLGPEAIEYLDALFAKIESAWSQWQNSMSWGTLTLTGGGVGAWAGSGMGGVLVGSPFTVQPFSFKGNSPQQLKFTKAICDAIASKFTPFPTAFKFTMVSYTGASGATPIAPGPVQAMSVPAPLMSAGSGVNPSGIAQMAKSMLTAPDFQLTSPQAKSGQLVDAIGSTIEQLFQTVWLATTMASANSFQGTGAPGGVVAGFPSVSDGKLV